MDKNNNSSLSEIAYSQIKEDIIKAIYKPGEVLSEGVLADNLGMSRQPIRLAIHRLYEEGWLSGMQRRNIRVSDVTLEDIKEIYDIRKILEIIAIDEIFEQDRTWEYSFALEEFILKMRANAKDQSKHELLDLDFHTYLINIFDNTRIEKFYYNIRESIYRINMLVNYEFYIEPNINELMDIVLNIRNKALDETKNLYACHLQKGYKNAINQFNNTIY